jgi:hypothetical protein
MLKWTVYGQSVFTGGRHTLRFATRWPASFGT